MIIVNAMFSRKSRKPRHRAGIETKNVVGIRLDLDWEKNRRAIHKELTKRKPGKR